MRECIWGPRPYGARHLFALVLGLPYDSALANKVQAANQAASSASPEPAEKAVGQRRTSVSGWGDLARTLSGSKAMKKRKGGDR